jgi:AcrR family transcriptional regulator
MELKLKRQRVLAEARRDLVLQAVRAAISEGGLESASIREIAARAGYTPGALYAYFSSKQALLAAVLKETIEGANAAAAQAKLPKSGGVTALHARANAWLAHFTARPGEVGVVLHLLAADGAGVGQAALVRQLTEDLQKSLDPIAQELDLMGCPPSLLKAEVTGLLAMALGVLLMRDSRRMSAFNAATLEAFTRYLDRLAAQFGAVPESQDDASAALQTDLFG